jgi:hypothetical protein
MVGAREEVALETPGVRLKRRKGADAFREL